MKVEKLELSKECECSCGYTCDRKCGLPIMECIEKHYIRDCGHNFNGPVKEFENGSSVTCEHCGMMAISHDMVCGI